MAARWPTPRTIDWLLITNKARHEERMTTMGIHHIEVRTLAGAHMSLRDFSGTVLLIVNVASRCGLTPQYEGLQQLHETYADRGFSVVGVPCNQFAEEEPGDAAEIADFCSTTYGVTFPMLEKSHVNGDARHDLYRELIEARDADGRAGDVEWNFEKFLIDGSGSIVGRFRPRAEPTDAAVTDAIERQLAAQ